MEKEIIPTNWYKTEQIETWIGQDVLIENTTGGPGKLLVIHQCGNNKEALIAQLETMISGIKCDFDCFGS